MSQPAHENPEHPANKREGKGRLLIWVFAGIVAVGIIVIAQVFLRQGTNSEDPASYTSEVQTACEQAARDELGDPNATISDVTVEVTGEEEPNYTYTATGSIEGAEGSGAAVTSSFTCDANYDVGTGRANAGVTLTD